MSIEDLDRHLRNREPIWRGSEMNNRAFGQPDTYCEGDPVSGTHGVNTGAPDEARLAILREAAISEPHCRPDQPSARLVEYAGAVAIGA